MTENSYCCEVAQEQESSLIGSAVNVDVWLLIEYAYAWKPKALEDNLLPTGVLNNIEALTQQFAAMQLKLRVQFVKQAATQLHSPRVFFADGRDGHWRLQSTHLSDYDAWPELEASALLDARVEGFTTLQSEIYLVCTNGQRDVCCARFGRPLYTELHREYGDRIWQTTHIGGHRYAPNLLCLPSGYVYGYVSPGAGSDLVLNHDRGVLDVPRLRGRSHYAPHVQAAEIFARKTHEVDGMLDISCVPPNGGADGSISYTGIRSGIVKVNQSTISNAPSSCEENPKPSVLFSQAAS